MSDPLDAILDDDGPAPDRSNLAAYYRKEAARRRGASAKPKAQKFADPLDAIADDEAPAIPTARDERATTTATTPAEARKEAIGSEKEKMRAGDRADRFDAAMYGLQRGLAPGADRFAGIGSDLGESVASLVHGLPAPEPDTAERARAEYAQKEAQAAKDYPLAYGGMEVIGAMPMTIGAAGSGVPLARGPAPLARSLTGAGITGSQIAASPAGRLALSNAAAGALNTQSDDPTAMLKGAAAQTLAGEVAGVAGQKIGGFLGKATDREYRGLMRDIMRNAETDVAANPTARRRFLNRADAALQEVKNDKVLAKTIREGEAESAARMAESKLQVISEPRKGLYRELDSHGVIGIDQLDAVIRKAERTATGANRDALIEFRNRLQDDWIPKWKEEGRLIVRDGKPLGVSGEGVREWVTAAQNSASKTLGTIAETEHAAVKAKLQDVAENLWDDHLRAIAKSDPKLIQNIRTYDRRASGLLALRDIMEQRTKKDAEGLMGFAKKHESKIDAMMASGAGLGAAMGHPVEATAGFGAYQLAKRVPAIAAAINDKALVPLQKAAMAGASWAAVANAAAETGVPQGMARTIFDAVQKARGNQSTQTSTAVR